MAGMFEGDGYPVRWARHRPGAFIELEIGGIPDVALSPGIPPKDEERSGSAPP